MQVTTKARRNEPSRLARYFLWEGTGADRCARDSCNKHNACSIVFVLWSEISAEYQTRTGTGKSHGSSTGKEYTRLLVFILCYIVILVLVFLPADYFNERQKLAFSAMLFVLVLVPSWWNSVSAFNWELEIFDDCFIHTDALGKKRRYRYDETEIRKPNKDTERVYVNGKYKFSIRCLYLNFEGLQKRVKHYKEKQQREQSSNERKETQQRVND